MINRGRTAIKLKYKSHGIAPINPRVERASVATKRGAIVQGARKRVIIKPTKNAPSGEVIL